mmetsp:Transcript_38552/g.77265  ORF Transcript_38552/g.77265 Transcript_38552/m.77265 type:complete len:221 (-) Transcript_38552:144-806(-)
MWAFGVSVYSIFFWSLYMRVAGIDFPPNPVNSPDTDCFSSNLSPHTPLKKTAFTSTAGPSGSSARMAGIFPFVLESTHLFTGSFPPSGNASASNTLLQTLTNSGLTSFAAHKEFATSSCTPGSLCLDADNITFTQSCTASSSPTKPCFSMLRSSPWAFPPCVVPAVAIDRATKTDKGEITTLPGSVNAKCLNISEPNAVTGLPPFVTKGACGAPAGPGTT